MPTPAEILSEINTDPTGKEYATCILGELPIDPGDPSKGTRTSASDASIADLMNVKTTSIRVKPEFISGGEFIEAVDVMEFDALTLPKQDRINAVMSMDRIPVNQRTFSLLTSVFGLDSLTEANLRAYLSRNGSRAEELWGIDTRITHKQVAEAFGRK